MVTPNTEPVSSESTSSTDVVDPIPSDGNEPLLPAGFEDRWSGLATGNDDTADEVNSDEQSTESQEATESTEGTPAAETVETPVGESTEEATESAEDETRTYTTEEWGKRESTYRQKQTENDTALANLQTEVTQMRDNFQNQLIDAEVRAYTSALQTQYVDEGMDEGQAQARAQRELETAKQDWLNTQENAQLKQRIAQTEADSATVAMKASVDHLMQEHGVPEAQRVLLNGYTNPELAVEAAKALGSAESLRKQSIEARQAEVPAGGEANTFDGGTGVGGTQTEADWLATVYNDPRRIPTSGDHARARKYLDSQGISRR